MLDKPPFSPVPEGGEPDSDNPFANRPPNPNVGFGQVRWWKPFDIAGLVAGATLLCVVDYEPEYWIISNENIANTELAIHIDTNAVTTPDLRLGPGQTCKIPGRGCGLVIINLGGATAKGSIVAVSGMDSWIR